MDSAMKQDNSRLDLPIIMLHGEPLRWNVAPGRSVEFTYIFDRDFGYKAALKFVDSNDVLELTQKQCQTITRLSLGAPDPTTRAFAAQLALLKDDVSRKQKVWELAGRPREPLKTAPAS